MIGDDVRLVEHRHPGGEPTHEDDGGSWGPAEAERIAAPVHEILGAIISPTDPIAVMVC
jgi:hypothetical protein